METRLESPQAMLLVVPNGKVKLLNALPFAPADLRRQTLQRRGMPTATHGGRRRCASSSPAAAPTRGCCATRTRHGRRILNRST